MSEEINPNLVEIKKFVKPDLVVIDIRKTYSGIEHFRLSFVFKESLVAEEQCDEEGNPTNGYRDTIYCACKLEGDEVIYMSPKFGWMVHEKATEKHANEIAEKELLK